MIDKVILKIILAMHESVSEVDLHAVLRRRLGHALAHSRSKLHPHSPQCLVVLGRQPLAALVACLVHGERLHGAAGVAEKGERGRRSVRQA